MTDIAWNVRVDSSVDAVWVVFAAGWYEAREIASWDLNVARERIHVSQVRGRPIWAPHKPSQADLLAADERIRERRFAFLRAVFEADVAEFAGRKSNFPGVGEK